VTSVDEKKPEATTTTAAPATKPRGRVGAAMAAVGRTLMWVPRRVAVVGRTPRRLLITLAVVAVVLAVALGALVWATQRHDASDAAGQEAQRVASQEVVALLSYDYHTARQDLPPVVNSLTGPFKDQYSQLLNQTVIPAAEQQQIATRTTLSGSAVTSATPDHVELLMFLNQTSVSAGSQQPQLEGSRAKVTLDLVDGQWKVSGLTPM
jgi:Mce-associated membrane protein